MDVLFFFCFVWNLGRLGTFRRRSSRGVCTKAQTRQTGTGTYPMCAKTMPMWKHRVVVIVTRSQDKSTSPLAAPPPPPTLRLSCSPL